jgi:hypothetical protein
MGFRADRQPVSTYDQALWWLINEWVDRFDVIKNDAELPPEGRLVCQMFWVRPDVLRRDLRRYWAEMFSDRPFSTQKWERA